MPAQTFTLWFVIIGVLLLAMALASTLLRRLPLTTAMLYLLVGAGLGPHGVGLIRLDALAQAGVLERAAEIAVLISLFTAGLKLRLPLRDRRWRLPIRLATLSMIVTVGAVAALGVVGLGLSLGAAVLLGAVLAPTDPVLASDVQVTHAGDRDRLRFSLTGEAGLNDGTAFPFVMLGLGLLGLHEVGAGGWRWWAVDVGWAVGGGLAVGAGLGWLVGRGVLYLRQRHQEAVGLDDFVALGVIALSYGAALSLHTYGFLAVFAAGLALRGIEREESSAAEPAAVPVAPAHASEEIATHPEHAPAFLAEAMRVFNEQAERIGEVVVVVLLGALLPLDRLPAEALWFVPLLFLVIRPAAVVVGTVGTDAAPAQRRMMAWFGVRGVGSVYYLMYAIEHGLDPALAERLTALTLTTVAVSIIVHGISVTPLMTLYERRSRPPNAPEPAAQES